MQKTTIFLIFCLFLCSCVTERKQKERADLYIMNHPQYIAEKCVEVFKVEPKYTKGVTIELIKTDPIAVSSLLSSVDSIHLQTLQGKPIDFDSLKAAILAKCKPTVVERTRVDTIQLPNPAEIKLRDLKIAELENKITKDQVTIRELTESRDEFRKKYRQLVYTLYGIGALIGVLLFFKFKSSILSTGLSVLKIFK